MHGTQDDGEFWAGLHDSVPDRPSAKVAPGGSQLTTMALTMKTASMAKRALHGRLIDYCFLTPSQPRRS